MKKLVLISLLSFSALAGQFKVISLSPHTTELAFEAGLGENLIAASAYSDYPEQAQQLERVANYRGINIERIIALKPDLVLAWQGGNPEKQLKKLKYFGIDIFYSNPQNLYDTADSIERLGRYAKNSSIAKKNAKKLRDALNQIKNRYENSTKVRYFYQLSSTPLMTNNGQHWPQPLFTLCGGENIFNYSPVPYPQVGVEQVVLKKPDAIFITPNTPELQFWRKWGEHIPAVKYNAIYTIRGDGLHRPSSRSLAAVEQICAQLEKVRRKIPKPKTEFALQDY